jgi:hypothetical protein
MVNVYTGGSASVFYDYETTFNTAVATTKPFGLNQKVTNLSVQTNRMNFNKLGQVETTAFAFGVQSGSVGIGFVFDDNLSHNIFESIYGEDTSNAHVYPATNAQGEAMTTMTGRSITTDIAVQMGANYKLRRLTGCVVNSIGLSTSIGQPVNGTIDMSFGKELSSTIDVSGATINQQGVGAAGTQAGNPYTFAHGHFKVHNGSSLQEIGEIQDCDINWATNSELLYGIGSHYAQSAYKKALDITGKFKASFKNSEIATHVLDQAKDTGNQIQLGNNESDEVGIELNFVSGSDSLKIELKGVAIGDYSLSGIEPVEPIFEDVSWKAKSAQITATQP